MGTRHIIESQQFSPLLIRKLFQNAANIERLLRSAHGKKRLMKLAQGQHLITFFYEESTRTRISFEVAAARLGMTIASTTNASKFSSVAKGESFEHTIRVLCGYRPDVIVLRHAEEGAARLAAEYADDGGAGVPIVNAGDGMGQHPTQALLDLFTIERELGRLDRLRVVIGGDLLCGRTTHSLVYLLSKYMDNEFVFVSPPELAMKPEILSYLDRHHMNWTTETSPVAAVEDADVVYWTRTQAERIGDKAIKESVERQKHRFVITPEVMAAMPAHARLMHPMPIVDEIVSIVDKDPRAAYLRQAANGLPVRMALLLYVLGFTEDHKLQ